MYATMAPTPALSMPGSFGAINAVLPQIRKTLGSVPFLRFVPSRAIDDEYVQDMKMEYEDPRHAYARIHSPEGDIFEARNYYCVDSFELRCFAAGALTYPRLTGVVSLLASTISWRPLRAAVIGPGYHLQSAAVLASLGFDIDVYDRDPNIIRWLQKSKRELPEKLQSRISFNPDQRRPVHIATWENPSPSESWCCPAVDIISGGYFLLQSEHEDSFHAIATKRSWVHLLGMNSYIFPTGHGRMRCGFVDNEVRIFQRQRAE